MAFGILLFVFLLTVNLLLGVNITWSLVHSGHYLSPISFKEKIVSDIKDSNLRIEDPISVLHNPVINETV